MFHSDVFFFFYAWFSASHTRNDGAETCVHHAVQRSVQRTSVDKSEFDVFPITILVFLR